MKNLTCKFILFLCIVLTSCSSDETATSDNSEFFNLNLGSKWIYKEYTNSTLDPTQFTFSGIINTVEIVAIENIQGFTFAKKSSQKTNINSGTSEPIIYSYVRINNEGHLIEFTNIDSIITETNGYVLHPINDFNFTHNYEVTFSDEEIYGNMEFSLYDSINSVVEGNSYLLLPYKGIFTPSVNHPELISKIVEYNYSQNIGLVSYRCHSLTGNYTWEERLVSYTLN